jgi:hypothetical protein
MTPKAVARHLSAGTKGRRGTSHDDARRYEQERGALASILKNYGVLSLLWLLPFYLFQGVVRVVVLVLSRRFLDAYQVVAAWGWNVAHLPGTVRRRVRAQSVRSIPDRAVRRSMAPAAIRLRRWAQAAGQAILPQPEGVEEEEPAATRTRALRFARDHPVATAWVLAAVAAAIAYRQLLGASPLVGGGLGRFPSSSSRFFAEFVSGIRHTGLGGPTSASPALGLLGLGSFLALGNPLLLERILLVALPALAAVGCYRAVRAATNDRLPSVVAGACYGLSSASLWAISEGRIPVLVFLAGVPWLAGKLALPFSDLGAIRVRRWIVGAALGLAVLTSFYAGSLLAAALIVVAALVVPPVRARRGRGILLVGVALILMAALTFPISFDLARGAFRSMADLAGTPSFGALARLSLGPGPGSWVTGFFLPISGGVAILFVTRDHQALALRAGAAAVMALYLSWLAAAGYLPAVLSNPVAYVVVAAFSESLLVGLGLSALLHRVSTTSFGLRQLGTALMAILLAAGLSGQLVQAAKGSWAIGGPDRIPAAYPLAGEAGGFPYRVLWIGSPDGDAFPAPGGLPTGVAPAGAASVRFAITGPTGASALDLGRPDVGPGYRRLRQSLVEILSGQTRHAGAALAGFAVRFVVADPTDLPPLTLRQLSRQVDLDLVSGRGLTIFGNAKAVPIAADIGDPAWIRGARSTRLDVAESLPRARATPLAEDMSGQRLTGLDRSGGGLVLLADQFDGRWRLQAGGSTVRPERMLGWATGFQTGPVSSGYLVRFSGQRSRTVGVILLILLWGAALWVTRRPVRHA